MIDEKEIQSITFGIYSHDEIVSQSVCCVNNTKKTGQGSVYDPRMGNSLNSNVCETCGENANNCTGHPGHIELSVPLVHPLYYRLVERLLGCVCFKCLRLMVTKDQLELENIKTRGLKRFESVCEKIKKSGMCCHSDCCNEKPKLRFSTTDNSINIVVEDKKGNEYITMKPSEIKNILSGLSDEEVFLLGFNPKLSHPKNYILTALYQFCLRLHGLM